MRRDLTFMDKLLSNVQKDSDLVREALDQLKEVGWAKQWSSQPYVSRRTVSLHGKCRMIMLFCFR